MDSFLQGLTPEARAAIDKIAFEERAAREDMKLKKIRTAGEAIADTTRTLPFSMRLTGAERDHLAEAAGRLNVTKTDLARQLIIEGLERLEARQHPELDLQKATMVVGEIIDLLERTGVAARFLRRGAGT